MVLSGGAELKKFDPSATATSSFFSKKTATIPLTFAAAAVKVKRNSMVQSGGHSSRGFTGCGHRNS